MHDPCLDSDLIHCLGICFEHQPQIPYSFPERKLGRGKAPIVVRIERGFVKVLCRCVFVRVAVGEGVDQWRQATEGAKRCAAACNGHGYGYGGCDIDEVHN